MSAPTRPSFDDLVRVLTDATERSALRWSATADQHTFRAAFEGGMVRVTRELGPQYILSFVDRDGVELDHYEPAEEQQARALEALYNTARHQALNLDGRMLSLYERLLKLVREADADAERPEE
jgi:hypothetical protein